MLKTSEDMLNSMFGYLHKAEEATNKLLDKLEALQRKNGVDEGLIADESGEPDPGAIIERCKHLYDILHEHGTEMARIEVVLDLEFECTDWAKKSAKENS